MSLQGLTADDPVSVGPYQLRGRLGAGGMGVVYLGFSTAAEPVAVKCLPRGVGPEFRSRLRREAELLAAVRDPRVARFVSADEHHATVGSGVVNGIHVATLESYRHPAADAEHEANGQHAARHHHRPAYAPRCLLGSLRDHR